MRKKEAAVPERAKIRISNIQIDMLSGIIAGIISNLISHPLDTLKVRLQLNRGGGMKFWPTIKEMYKYEGVTLVFEVKMDIDNRILEGGAFSHSW